MLQPQALWCDTCFEKTPFICVIPTHHCGQNRVSSSWPFLVCSLFSPLVLPELYKLFQSDWKHLETLWDSSGGGKITLLLLLFLGWHNSPEICSHPSKVRDLVLHPKFTLFPVPAQSENAVGDRCCSNLTLRVSRHKKTDGSSQCR